MGSWHHAGSSAASAELRGENFMKDSSAGLAPNDRIPLFKNDLKASLRATERRIVLKLGAIMFASGIIAILFAWLWR